MRALFLFLLLLPAPVTAAFVAGDNDRTLSFAGNQRTYRVHVPPGASAGPLPLVVDIHGWSTTSALQQSISGMQAVSDREGFLVVWPQGLNNQWNAGVCCGNAGLDDVGFLRAVVDAVAAEGPVDRRRVYVTGLSNGGAMSHKLACEASDVFAAAAPMAFPLPYATLTTCQPARPIPLLMVMGLTDMLIPYDGGTYASAPASFARWRDLHGCAGTPALVPHGQGRCETFAPAQCASGQEVRLCSIVAAAFPDLFFDGHILYLNDDLDLAEEAWRFLSRFRQPPAWPVAPSALSGTVRLRLGAHRGAPESATWEVALGSATWMVQTAAQSLLEGAPSGRDRRRKALLTLDEAARATLLAELAARVESLTGLSGAQLVLGPTAALKVRLDAQGVPIALRGTVKLLHDDGTQRTAGRLTIRLRR